MPRQAVQMRVCVCVCACVCVCVCTHAADRTPPILPEAWGSDPHLWRLASSGSCPHLGTVNREGSSEHPCLDGTFQNRETSSVGFAEILG